ncbi:hypothetical protein C8A01DRAFT_13002 [Parachaetomium inaequale]|uniref:Uncharacterized protein n=1 Tax=Parachaetomium inaequale TaxID=2588326 RepID=A0AAN6PP73_9PEZI|nr:hypothetical protein C8A01DRAFT_13002 [Parachaetomium inaequale]
MPPKGTPAGEKKERTTNFKSYETQARLLSALVASLGPNPKIDYKQVARYYGGGATESSVEHKLRNTRAQADLIRKMVAANMDPGDSDVPFATKAGKTRRRSQPAAATAAAAAPPPRRYFGASTPDGLNFQFRAIKKGADALKTAAEKGQDPIDAFAVFARGGSTATGSVPTTPSTTKRARPTKTTGSGSRATPASKRQKAMKIEPEPEPDMFDEDEDSPEVDYSELDTTPTKLKPKVHTTPRKNPPLQPHPAWPKPAQKTTASRPVPIAPAPPRPMAPRPEPEATPFRLMPIAGVGSSALPNGYTNPATGFGYNVAPPAAVNSATPSAANSPAMGMSTDRRGSAYSSGSYTAASSPATPNMSYPDPSSTTTSNVAMNNAGMNMSTTNGMTANGMNNRTNPNMATANMPSFNTNMFDSATSPAASTPDVAHTPQTTTSSTSTMPATTAPSGEDEFNPFCDFGRIPTTNNGYITVGGGDRSYSRNDPKEAALAGDVDFGGFEDQEEEEDDDGCV